MPQSTVTHSAGSWRRSTLNLLHFIVIALSIVLLYVVTRDTLDSISLLTDKRYLRIQFWICMVFILETIAEWLLTPRTIKRTFTMMLLLLLCVPYITIIHHFHLDIPVNLYYLLRVMPLVRAATVLVVMWGLMEKNWVTGVFGSYIIILLITLYVLSLLFYVEEHAVNSSVYDYWQALWYSFMQMNTCGSNISPHTPDRQSDRGGVVGRRPYPFSCVYGLFYPCVRT